jgi:hypothetical protein
MTKAILADITAGLFSQVVIAYAVSYEEKFKIQNNSLMQELF